MDEFATLSSKGQVVVPRRIRKALQADAGTRLGFTLRGDQAVMFVVRSKTGQPGEGYGLLKGKGRKVALKDWEGKLRAARRKQHARG